MFQFVLCVHYTDDAWGMIHTADMWVLGQLLGGCSCLHMASFSNPPHAAPLLSHLSWFQQEIHGVL